MGQLFCRLGSVFAGKCFTPKVRPTMTDRWEKTRGRARGESEYGYQRTDLEIATPVSMVERIVAESR